MSPPAALFLHCDAHKLLSCSSVSTASQLLLLLLLLCGWRVIFQAACEAARAKQHMVMQL
jgi:hypothetical protein